MMVTDVSVRTLIAVTHELKPKTLYLGDRCGGQHIYPHQRKAAAITVHQDTSITQRLDVRLGPVDIDCNGNKVPCIISIPKCGMPCYTIVGVVSKQHGCHAAEQLP